MALRTQVNMAPRRRRSLGLAGICLGTALIVMEANVVNLAIPTIRVALRADAAESLWMVDSYTLVLAAFLLSAGRLGDRIGARRSYLFGLGLFAAASFLCCLAPNVGLLIAARALQGLGAALLAPAPLTLISHLYTEQTDRTRAIATWVSVGGVGFVVGPLFSGVLIDLLGWRSVFAVNIPIAAILIGLVVTCVDESPKYAVAFDLPGQILAIAGLAAIITGLVQSSIDGWSSLGVCGALAAGMLILGCFVRSQRAKARRGSEVLLPESILSTRPVLAGLLSGAVYNFTLYGMLYVFTFDFQDLRHFSALATGLAFLPLTLVTLITAKFVGGPLVARSGPRLGMIIGMTTSASAFAILIFGTDHVPYPLDALGFGVFAVGLAISASAQTLSVMSYAPNEHKNMGSSALNTARQTGGVIGVALLGAIVANHLTQGTPVAMAIALFACVAVAVGGARMVPRGREILE